MSLSQANIPLKYYEATGPGEFTWMCWTDAF